MSASDRLRAFARSQTCRAELGAEQLATGGLGRREPKVGFIHQLGEQLGIDCALAGDRAITIVFPVAAVARAAA